MPEKFSLASNFNAVVTATNKIRQSASQQGHAKKPQSKFYVDFRSIREISPSAALVLVAELDRYEIITKNKLYTVDAKKWDPKVRVLLEDMGFFGLLRVKKPKNKKIVPQSNLKYVQFVTGEKAVGESIQSMLKRLEEAFGDLPQKIHLYSAITEAVINVVQHAYTKDETNECAKWWLSGSYDTAEKVVTILVYDQGVGIPKTIRTENFSEKFKSALSNASHRDAYLIELAHYLGKTTTSKKQHRGFGLGENIRHYIEKLGNDANGVYTIFSLKGKYVYQGKSEFFRNKKPLNGTLIQWEIRL